MGGGGWGVGEGSYYIKVILYLLESLTKAT